MVTIKNEEYNNYYNCLVTFKMNRDVKKSLQRALEESGITFQDFLDDVCRDAAIKRGIEESSLPKKIRKHTVIQ